MRPPRPAMVEAAAAILIMLGVAGIAAQLLAMSDGTLVPSTGAEPIVLVQVTLIALTITVGFLVRAGRAWSLCLAVVGIIMLLDLAAVPSGNAFALVFSLLDVVVFVTLLRHRWWFEWRAPLPDAMDDQGGAGHPASEEAS